MLLAALAAGCLSSFPTRPSGTAVIFVLDAPMDEGFVEGRAAGLSASQVTHGSLVGRVLRSYCRTRLVSVPVRDGVGGMSRESYLQGLRTVLQYAEDHAEARIVVNISLGSSERDDEEQALIGRLVSAGVLVVAAAGNDGADRLDYPAAYPGVVAVASATEHGKAATSNCGANVAIAASGDVTFIDYEFLPQEWLRRETDARGTSFAAPRVAATVGYLMDRKPRLSPEQAFEILRQTARPVADPYYTRGELGAGLLDVRRARSAVDPFYGFVHFVLPVSVWVILGIVSIFLCVRYGLVGAFLTLMMWLVAVPASVLLVLKLRDYLEFVGGGNLVVGLGVTGVFAAAIAVAALIQHWQVAKAVLALLIPFAAFVLLALAGLTATGGPIAGALASAAAGVAIALAVEARTRRRLAAIRAFPREARASSALLLSAYRRALDDRVKTAVVGVLDRAPDEEAVEFLLSEAPARMQAVASLARIASQDLVALVPTLWAVGSLDRTQRQRLLDALRKADNAEAMPILEEIAPHDRSGDVLRLVESLKARRRAGE
jgi:hypothetical protein